MTGEHSANTVHPMINTIEYTPWLKAATKYYVSSIPRQNTQTFAIASFAVLL